MSEEAKICPFMSGVSSRSAYNLIEKRVSESVQVVCIREHCMAWGECVRQMANAYNEPVYEFWTGCRLIP